MSSSPLSLRNALGALALMLLAALLALALTPRMRLVETLGPMSLERAVPTSFGDWALEPMMNTAVVSPQEQAFVQKIYGQTLGRVYVNGEGQRVMVSVAYGEDQRRESSLHYPEVCYPAQGFAIRSRSRVQLDLPSGPLTLRRLETMQGSDRPEPLSYWVVVGERRVEGGLAKKWALVRYGLQGEIADGLIFRVSSIGQDSRAQFLLQEHFIAALIAALPASDRRRLVGQT